MIGIPAGLVYMLPVSIFIFLFWVCCWKYYPFNRGMVTGLIIAGYGFGAFIFNFVCKAICNPNNQEPTVEYTENGKITKYFSSSVFENVPFMF